MKHLNKFYKYLNESTSLDKEEIEDNLLGLKDLGCSITSEYTNTVFNHKNTTMYYITIKHKLDSNFIYYKHQYDPFMFNKVYWEILNEILVIKDRLGDKYDLGVNLSNQVIRLCIVEK